MTTYYCKCGRKVKKSTSADNTGNRDVQDCKGCPYLLDYGKYAYDAGKGYHLEVTGKECRMSKDIDYRTSYHGHADDKCSMNIMTLDFDFLRRVLSWIASNCKDGELSCSFSPETIRPTDYCNKGRLSVPIYCAQNKKGMAAKAALIDHFFTESKFRRDINPESEKQLILDRIKACRDSKEKHMDNYILAQRDENQRIYALKFDTFWFWHQNKWVVSDFAAQQYEKARGKDEHLSKAAWLSLGMFANPLDDYEVPDEMLKSIRELSKKDVKECTNTNESANVSTLDTCSQTNLTQTTLETVEDANTSESTQSGDSSPSTSSGLACPAETAPAAQSPSGVGPASLAPFDYTGLPAETAERLRNLALRASKAKQRYILDLMEIVVEAHMELVQRLDNSKHGNRGEDTFRAWCASIGVSRSTAYNLIQVQALMDGSTPEEQEVLAEAPARLLYAAAKPSAPAELVQGVKDGDITSHKQYKELLARLNAATARADGMVEEINSREAKINNLIAYSEEADRRTEEEERKRKDLQRELDAERASNAGSSALLADEQQRRQKADEARIAAEKRAAEAEKSLEGARHVVEASKRRDEKARSEIDDLRAQLADLKSKPIDAPVVDAEELDRMASEKADAIVEQRLAELAPGEDALHNAQDAVILAVRIIDSISQLLMPHMGVLDNDQIMEACETISRATSKLNGGLAKCLKN